MNSKQRMNQIKKQAMLILRQNKLNDDIKEIPNIFGIDKNGLYYHMVLDYPNTRYKQILNLKDDNEFIKYIVKETIYERDLNRIL